MEQLSLLPECAVNTRTITVERDPITTAIVEPFDYEWTGTTTTELPCLPTLPNVYKIGAIVGPSGSGKTTLLHTLAAPTQIQWDGTKSIAAHFADVDEARTKLMAVGLNDIPSWCKPFHVLSNGEQFRATLARQLHNGAALDEFTSVVDRNVAQAASCGLKRYVDAEGLHGIVVASCHYDILPWLRPCWVYDLRDVNYYDGRWLQRPSLQLEIHQCTTGVWPMFAKHHYLSGEISNSARCFIGLLHGEPIAFTAVIPFPHGSIKDGWREHRTVLLPDYQGVGIGVRWQDAIAQLFIDEGKRYFSRTAHPRIGQYRDNCGRWKPTACNHETMSGGGPNSKIQQAGGKWDNRKAKPRVCFSHEYIGMPPALDNPANPS